MSTTFDQANDLWFNEGRTYQAIAAYRACAERWPDAPAIALQLARALWAVEEPDAARRELARVDAAGERLSPMGRELAEELHGWLAATPPAAPVPPGQLDVDWLERASLDRATWSGIVAAARARLMTGVALFAFERSRPVVSGDDARDWEELDAEAQAQLDYLAAAATPPPPLRLEADVRPRTIVDDALLTVTLTNRSDEPIAVNGRLILNHLNAPPEHGELALLVAGPLGYRNLARCFVRVGAPDRSAFRLLQPGQRVGARYPLLEHESLHEPGRYVLRVVYRNVVDAEVAGVPAFVGSLTSDAVELRRE